MIMQSLLSMYIFGTTFAVIGFIFLILLIVTLVFLFGGKSKDNMHTDLNSTSTDESIKESTAVEYLFNNSRSNSYKTELSDSNNDFGGYYGMQPSGFGDPREENYIHPLSGEKHIPKPEYSLKDPGPLGSLLINEVKTINDDDDNGNDELSKMKNLLAQGLIGGSNKGPFEKKHKKMAGTGSVQEVGELQTAATLSANNNFEDAFGRNSNAYGDPSVQTRYIKPIDKKDSDLNIPQQIVS